MEPQKEKDIDLNYDNCHQALDILQATIQAEILLCNCLLQLRELLAPHIALFIVIHLMMIGQGMAIQSTIDHWSRAHESNISSQTTSLSLLLSPLGLLSPLHHALAVRSQPHHRRKPTATIASGEWVLA